MQKNGERNNTGQAKRESDEWQTTWRTGELGLGAQPGYALSWATLAPHRPAIAAMRALCTSMACVKLLRVDMVRL